MNLKAECHRYVDILCSSRYERRCIYRWLGRKLRRMPLHFAELNTEQLLHARRLLRDECRKRGAEV